MGSEPTLWDLAHAYITAKLRLRTVDYVFLWFFTTPVKPITRICDFLMHVYNRKGFRHHPCAVWDSNQNSSPVWMASTAEPAFLTVLERSSLKSVLQPTCFPPRPLCREVTFVDLVTSSFHVSSVLVLWKALVVVGPSAHPLACITSWEAWSLTKPTDCLHCWTETGRCAIWQFRKGTQHSLAHNDPILAHLEIYSTEK